MKRFLFTDLQIYLFVLLFILILSLKAQASDQFLSVDGQILNRMSVVTVDKVKEPCKSCICSMPYCDKWHFYVWPTTNYRAVIPITGKDYADIQAKHKLIEDWLIKGQ